LLCRCNTQQEPISKEILADQEETFLDKSQTIIVSFMYLLAHLCITKKANRKKQKRRFAV